jgi:DNA polymerase-4
VTVPVALSATLTVAEAATELARAALTDHPRERQISLLAVSVSRLVDEPALQLALPFTMADDRHRPGTKTGSARWAADRSVDAIRARFGQAAVGYATVMFSNAGGVPEAFRELAERGPRLE